MRAAVTIRPGPTEEEKKKVPKKNKKTTKPCSAIFSLICLTCAFPLTNVSLFVSKEKNRTQNHPFAALCHPHPRIVYVVHQQKTREADFAASLKVQSSGGKKSLKGTEANVSDAGDDNARVGVGGGW